MLDLFSKEPVNTGRQPEMDFAKCLAIVFMVFVHVLICCPTTVPAHSPYDLIVNFLGAPPAAPVFMFCLGVGLVYSRHSTPNLLVRRGLWLWFLGYLLNFLRGTLPLLVGASWIDPATPLLGGASVQQVALRHLFMVDILPFAGLAFLFFALVKQFRLSNVALIFISLGLGLLEQLIPRFDTGNHFLNNAVGLFVWMNHDTDFPFLSWIHYPILGYLFAWVLIRCQDKKRFYCFLFFAGGLAFVSSTLLFHKYGLDLRGFIDGELYYAQDFFHVSWCLFFIFMWLGLLYFVSRYITEGFLLNVVKRWSKNLNAMYIVHWVILGWSLLVMPELNILGCVVVSIVILMLTDIIVTLHGKWKQRNDVQQTTKS